MTHAQLASNRRAILGSGAGWMLLILLTVLANALPYGKLVNIDDAYISYRYAENLLRHGQLVYNLAGDKAFAATSPGYTVILAALGALGLPLDFVGFAIGVIGILVAGWALMDLLRRWPLCAGVGAGLLLVLLPLPWLVIGMESVAVMALVLLSYALTFRRHYAYAAALLIVATIFRFDAASAAAAWGLSLLLTLRLKAVRPIVIYGLGTLATYVALRIFLHVPLPTTLASKQAQVELGISGFPPHTAFLSAARLLADAHFGQSPAYLIAGLLAVAGIVGLALVAARRLAGDQGFEEGETGVAGSDRSALLGPVLLLALWAVLNLVAYLLLHVSPYLWYYLPFFPLIAALVAAGITAVALGLARLTPHGARMKLTLGVAVILWTVTLAGPIASHLAIRNAQPELGGGGAPVAQSLLLPNSQWGPYKTIGERLRSDTPITATVGMTEIGVVGYYGQRPVVDFLGLLDTDIASAMSRGDMAWALYAKQPDYLVLGKGYPMYSFNVYQSRWFQTNYAPKWVEPNRVPEGNWWTVYQRKAQPLPSGVIEAVPASAEPLSVRFGDEFELVGFEAPPGPWRPEDPTGFTLYWRTLKQPSKDYTLFVHLRDGRGNIIAGGDAPPMLRARPTSQWRPGELIADYQPLGSPPMPLAPTTLQFEVGFYDSATGARLPAFGPDGKEIPGGQAQFGKRALMPASDPIRFGSGDPGSTSELGIQSYHLSAPSLARGRSDELELVVNEVMTPVQVTAELWDWPGQRVIWQQQIPVAGAGVYKLPLNIRQDEPANEGELRIRVSREGAGLSWLDQVGHAINDYVPLTPLTIGSS